MFYHQASNQHIREGNPFAIDGVQYPSNWLNLSTPEQKTALGLVEVTTVGTREDDRYFYVSEELSGAVRRIVNIRKSDEQLEQIRVSEVKQAIAQLEAGQSRSIREATLTGDKKRLQELDDAIAALRATL